MSNSYLGYAYVVISQTRGDRGITNNHRFETSHSYDSESAALRQAQILCEKNTDRYYAVAKVVCQAEAKDVIKDRAGKIYTLEKDATHITVKAPCGETQTFSRKDLEAMLNDTN